MALKWNQGQGFRAAAVSPDVEGRAGFTLIEANVAGVHFTNVLSEVRSMYNANLMNGSGVALGDYDDDGWCDIYLCNLSGPNRLFRNKGNWVFEDVTAGSGTACAKQTSTGAVFADIDGDHDLDLLVTSMGGPNACLLNDGNGRFKDVTTSAGLASTLGSTSMALADIDGDADLDLYVANYGATSILRSGGALNLAQRNGEWVVRGRYARRVKLVEGMMFELGEPDAFYLNDGKGRFQAMSWTGGAFLDSEGQVITEEPWDQGLSVIFRDVNGDLLPDLYLCNDAFTPDRFWINLGGGKFKALDSRAIRKTSYFSMGVDFADINRDGVDDFFVVDMLSREHEIMMTQRGNMHRPPRPIGEIFFQPQLRRNTLFLGRSDGTFAEIGNYAGVSASEWTWGAIFLDVDLDGWEDLLVSNGFSYDVDNADVQDKIKSMGQLPISESRRTLLLFPPLITPNAAFHNQRNLRFELASDTWGFNSTHVSNGMALGDLDNDGDLDVVVNCLNAPPLLYRNGSSAPRIGIRLKGRPPNTQGIGARLRLSGGPVQQSQEVMSGGRYMSGDDPMRVFAAGKAQELALEVVWRNGERSVISGLKPNHIYEVDQSTASKAEPARPSRSATPFFSDISERLQHRHVELPYPDFELQPLLPKRLSQLGPGVTWCDFDRDGNDDLIIGSGRGGLITFFRSNGDGTFAQVPSGAPVEDDTAGMAVFPDKSGVPLAVGLASYERRGESDLRLIRVGEKSADEVTRIPLANGSTGPIAVADLEGDGDLDLFVGVRLIAGKYPESAGSLLFRNGSNGLQMDAETSQLFDSVGLVSGAIWSDLELDGFPELILACEWGPVRVFGNQGGKLKEQTAAYGLEPFRGWWTGVITADIDSDGALDIVAGNWGLNSDYNRISDGELVAYYGDLDGDGRNDIIEAYRPDSLSELRPWRDFGIVTSAVPSLRQRFSSYGEYANATAVEVAGPASMRLKQASVNHWASTVFFRRGDRFEPKALPDEVQFSPTFGLVAGDFDGDGDEDLIAGQNWFATRPEDASLDAGRSVFLEGDGRGGLFPVPAEESGLLIYGEARGAAVSDFDKDGRLDVVIAQNGAATKLYRNEQSRPGLRVRLSAGAGNPDGIGAVLWARYSDGSRGPARQVHGGSGYWSQGSMVQVIKREGLESIEVLWPGGNKTETQIKGIEGREIEINLDGRARPVF